MSKRRIFFKQMAMLSAGYPLQKAAQVQQSASRKKRTIVCVGGHPDDPESGCGGTLCLHARAGDMVHIIYLTSGEAGIPGKSHAEAGATRKAEATAACQVMGAKPYFFGQVDGATRFDGAEITRMQDLLRSLQPDILYTHWPVDSHPDHQVASLLSYQSWLRLGKVFPVYYFEVNSGDQTQQFAPTDYIDITAVADQKKKALFAHQTQEPNDIYFNHHHIMQQYRGREIGVKEAEAFVRLDAQKATWGI